MAKMYLPIEVNDTQCITIVSDGHVRIYDKIPNGTSQRANYTDFYIRDNYLSSSGQEDFSQWTTKNCIDYTQFTTDFWYRPDIWQSLICFVIIGGIGIYLPFKIISRLFGRWFKV